MSSAVKNADETSSILDRVTAFAEQAHEGQRRKYTPERYMVHPIRVMKICREHTDDVTMLAAALLHDVLEDTPVTKEELRAFLESVMEIPDAERTIGLVSELTDEYVKEVYPKLNRRGRKELERARIAQTSEDSQTIKYADILDNCREIVEHDPDFARVFLRECEATLRVANRGNAQLYALAMDQVKAGLRKLTRR